MSLLDRHCEDVLELMTAYLQRTMPPDELTTLEAHMVYCPGCSGFMAQLRGTVEALRELPAPPLGDGERDELIAAFRAAAASVGSK
jgi:anti-sigma factor RsiW